MPRPTRLVLPVVILAALAAGCGFKPQKLLATYETVEVEEVRRDLHCGTADEETRVQLLPGKEAATAWAQRRGLDWGGGALADVPYALIEMGQRATGGYGLAVSRSAVQRGGLLILTATFITPPEGRPVTMALSSPCVLVQLPAGRYSTLEVKDQTGSVRASGSEAEPEPESRPPDTAR